MGTGSFVSGSYRGGAHRNPGAGVVLKGGSMWTGVVVATPPISLGSTVPRGPSERIVGPIDPHRPKEPA